MSTINGSSARAADDSVLFDDIFRIKTYDLKRRVEEDSRAFLLSPVRPLSNNNNNSSDHTLEELSSVRFSHSPFPSSPSPHFVHKNHVTQLLEGLSKAPPMEVGKRYGKGDRFYNKEPYGPESGFPPLNGDAWLYGLNIILAIADERRGKGRRPRRAASSSSSIERTQRSGTGENNDKGEEKKEEKENDEEKEATKGFKVPPPTDPTCPALRHIASMANERYELHQYDAVYNPTAMRLLEWGARKQERSKSYVEKERHREEVIRARKAQMQRASRQAATHDSHHQDTHKDQHQNNDKRNHHNHNHHHIHDHLRKTSWDGRTRSGKRLFSEFLPEDNPERQHVSVYDPKDEVEAKHCTFSPTIRNPNEGRERRKPEAFYSGGLEWKKHCDKKMEKKKERIETDAKEQEEIDFAPWKMNAYSEKLLVRKFNREKKNNPTGDSELPPTADIIAQSQNNNNTTNTKTINAAALAFLTSTESHALTKNYPPFLERTMDDINWRRERTAEREKIREKLEVRCNRSPEISIYIPAVRNDAEGEGNETNTKKPARGATIDEGNLAESKHESSGPRSKSNRRPSENVPEPIRNPNAFFSPPTTPRSVPSKNSQTSPTSVPIETRDRAPSPIKPLRSKPQPSAVSPPRSRPIQVSDTNVQTPASRKKRPKRSDAPVNRTGVMCFSPFMDDDLAESSLSLLSFSLGNWSQDQTSPLHHTYHPLKHTKPYSSDAEEDAWVVNRIAHSSHRRTTSRPRSPLTEQERRVLEMSRRSPHHPSRDDFRYSESPNRSPGKRRALSPQAQRDFHERQELWMRRREGRRSALFREKEANDVSECTHRPTLNHSFNNNAARKHFLMAALPVDSSPEDRFHSAAMAATHGMALGGNLFDPLLRGTSPSPQRLARQGSPGIPATLKDEIMFSSAAKQNSAWKKQGKHHRLRNLTPSARRASPYYSILNYNDIRELQLKPQKARKKPKEPQSQRRDGSSAHVAHSSAHSRNATHSQLGMNEEESVDVPPEPDTINDWLNRSRGRPRLSSPALSTSRSVDATRGTSPPQPLVQPGLSQELLEGLSDWWVSIVDANRSTSAVRIGGTTLFPTHMFADDAASTSLSPFQCNVARSLALEVLAQAFGENALKNEYSDDSQMHNGEGKEWVSFNEFVNMYRPLVC